MFNFLFLIVSIERGELVIRDLGNSFINHQVTQLWSQVCMNASVFNTPAGRADGFSFLCDSRCRSYEFWRLATRRSAWTPPALTPPPSPSI